MPFSDFVRLQVFLLVCEQIVTNNYKQLLDKAEYDFKQY